ncbi:hypothetical protein H5410_006274 [Solanum commersonii]|uniref:Uncharacterized protein n=1 Tax=Solanum commersonii TaxID=4109 RepID=A0A9J6A9F1_SOLCO|nr:hypothetical protein H5410_006274 [Solanum commersonii]
MVLPAADPHSSVRLNIRAQCLEFESLRVLSFFLPLKISLLSTVNPLYVEDVEELVCPGNHEPSRYKKVLIKKVFKVCCSCNGLALLLIDGYLLL